MKRWFKSIALTMLVVLALSLVTGCGPANTLPTAAAGQSQTESLETLPVAEETEEAAATEAAAETAAAQETEAVIEIETIAEEETEATEDAAIEPAAEAVTLDPDGSYNSYQEVALYIHTYGKLPGNYLTKKQAQKLGWSGGSLENYAPGKSIGGSYFGNNEGLLPDGEYHECDIDTLGKSKRGAKRIVFCDDGCIYYTNDHYESFHLLYTADGPVENCVLYDANGEHHDSCHEDHHSETHSNHHSENDSNHH